MAVIVKLSKWIFTALVVFTTAGCSAHLIPVSYSGPVTIQTDMSAHITLNTGRVDGQSGSTVIYTGAGYMPISSGPTPALQFGVEDQQVFVESLKSELVGSGIIRNIEAEKSQDDLNIMVNFVQTMHYPNVHEYVLVVEMICLYEDLVGSRMYQISSSEGDTFWEKMNTDASEGKEKAAIKLIDALIPDIQNFILEVQAREILAAPEGVRI